MLDPIACEEGLELHACEHYAVIRDQDLRQAVCGKCNSHLCDCHLGCGCGAGVYFHPL